MPITVPSTAVPGHPGRFLHPVTGTALAVPDRGVPLLAAQLGPAARLIVEAAIGADLTADPATWTWYDLTRDVLAAGDGKVLISPIGRGDEFTQAPPAQCVFDLLNTSGDYTAHNTASRWWPWLVHNTPVRVIVNLTGLPADDVVRFQGGVIGWPQSYDQTGELAIAHITAGGVMRREQQGEVLDAAVTRSIAASSPLGWWPLDDPAGTRAPRSGVAGASPAAASSAVVLGQAGAAGLATVAQMSSGGQVTGTVPATTVVDRWQIEISMRADVTGSSGNSISLRWDTTGTWQHWDLIPYDLAGTFAIYVTVLTDSPFASGTALLAPMVTTPYDGLWHHYRITAVQSGTSLAVELWLDDVRVATNTLASASAGRITTWESPHAPHTDEGLTAIAQVAAYDELWSTPLTNPMRHGAALTGYAGETTTDRFARLGMEEGEHVTVVGTSTTPMGPQTARTLVDLWRECEAAEQGLLVDGLGPGPTLVARSATYNRRPDLVVDAAALQLADPPDPADDDQRTRNQWTVTRSAGGSPQTVRRVDGPLGTAVVGRYGDSASPNVVDDDTAYRLAGWLTRLGTADGYRYARAVLDMAATPELAAAWLAVPPRGRIDVAGVQAVAPTHPAGTVSVLAEGWAETLSPFDWDVVINSVPFESWRVGQLGDPLNPLRLDTAGSVLAVGAAGGALLGADGTFESGVSGWSPSAATFVQSSAQAHGGTAAGLLTVVGAPSQAYVRSPLVPAVPGQLYRITFWVYSAAGVGNVQAAADWWRDGLYQATTVGALTVVAAATWTLFDVVFTAPDGINQVQVGPTLAGSPAAGTAVWLDDITLSGALSVATTSGPLWITTAGRPTRFPFDIEVAAPARSPVGRRLTVTAITGSASPQTFWVDQVPVDLEVGAAVRLYQPAVLAY